MKAYLLGVLSEAMLLISACGQPQESLPVLRIGHAPHDHHSPLYIAAMNPVYFQAQGSIYLKEVSFRKEYELVTANHRIAQVLIESNTGGKELIRRLSEEQFDISFGGFPAMLSFIDKENPIHILAPVMTEGTGLIVSNDLPVNSWSEFLDYVHRREKNLRIGYKIAVSVQNLIFEQALKMSNISFSSTLDDPTAMISLVNLHGAKNLIPALENGIIDGFVINQPYLAIAESRKAGKLIALLRDMPPNDQWHDHPCCALAGNDAFVQKHPAVAEAFTTLILRANQFIVEHPEKSAEQIARWLELSPIIEELSLPTIKFTAEFDETWHTGVRFWVDSMVENGKLTGKVKDAHNSGNLQELIYDMQMYHRARRNLE